MMVMPANSKKGIVHYWAGKLPGCVGHIWGLTVKNRELKAHTITLYDWLPYALDNGRFIAWDKGIEWPRDEYMRMLDSVAFKRPPLFAVAPDFVGEKERTLDSFYEWLPVLRGYRFPVAIAVQDGMTPVDVPKEADWIFVGGTDRWKMANLRSFTKTEKPVHVGRVNTGKRLWECHEAGAVSCDGSGWFRGDYRQLQSLENYWSHLAGDTQRPHQDQLRLDFDVAWPFCNTLQTMGNLR